jgi:hypothetical protein
MLTFESMKTPPTRELADVTAQARFAPDPVKYHTHVQQVARCTHVHIAGGADGHG